MQSSTMQIDSILMCGHAYDSNSSTSINLALLHFYGQGVSVLIIGIFGIIGNVLSIITISSMHTLSIFNKLLITLAVFDVTFIITDGFFTVQSAFELVMPLYYKIFPVIIYPIAGFSMTGSTYSCLSIAADRFIGICHPNRDYCFKKYHFYLLGILITCTVIDLPRFFEIQTVFDDLGEAIGLAYTELRTDAIYVVASMWYRLLTTIIIPFVIMLFFNMKVFYYYRKNSLQSHQDQERSLLFIFSCITITFFICHLPRAILNIHEFQLQHSQALCQALYRTDFVEPLWARITYHIEKILLIFNASVNFLYYCFSGQEFRNRFCAVISCYPNQLLLPHQLDQEMHLAHHKVIPQSSTKGTQEEDNVLLKESVHLFDLTLFASQSQLEHQSVPYGNNICEQFLGHIYRDHKNS